MLADSQNLIAGRYRLDGWLGRGGMGEVRAATDLRLDREVAVKLLRADLAHQIDLRRRFEREARAAARISHPNIVAVFDTGEHDAVPFIVMERLPGDTLADEIAAGPLSCPRACTVLLEVLSALAAAHAGGVLHRDIKPGNILRAPDGHAKVADFGIAKVAEETDPKTTGMLLGTAAYLAPERLSGEPATAASDLYSVGVVLYEALAGRLPFQADSPLGLVAAISLGQPRAMTDVRPDVPVAVGRVIERAMSKDPQERFVSAAQMGAALLEAGDASALAPADRPTVALATPDTARPDRARAPSAATEIAPAPTAPAVQGPRQRPRVARRAKRWMAAITVALLLVALLVVGITIAVGDSSTPHPASTTPTTAGPRIPTRLERAIDRLDQAVRP